MVKIPMNNLTASNLDKWDQYFYSLCTAVSFNSTCMSRQIGAVVANDSHIILSTGYNSPPRGAPDCKHWHHDNKMLSAMKERTPDYMKFIDKNGNLTTCPRRVMSYESGEGLQYCPAAHAERNAIDNAANVGVALNEGILYCTCDIPCSECLKSIIQAGIGRIVVNHLEFYDTLSEYILGNSTIIIREFYNPVWSLYNQAYGKAFLNAVNDKLSS